MATIKQILVFLVLFLISFCIFVTVDIQSHGSLEASAGGRLLKEAGLLIHVKPYYNQIEKQVTWYSKWLQKNIFTPKFKANTMNYSKKIYDDGSKSMKLLAVTLKEKFIIGFKTLESYLPPDFGQTVMKYFWEAFYIILQIGSNVVSGAQHAYHTILQWLKTNEIIDDNTWNSISDGFSTLYIHVAAAVENLGKWASRKISCLLTS